MHLPGCQGLGAKLCVGSGSFQLVVIYAEAEEVWYGNRTLVQLMTKRVQEENEKGLVGARLVAARFLASHPFHVDQYHTIPPGQTCGNAHGKEYYPQRESC